MLNIDTDACGIRGSTVLCAVSGGADSVCLLRLLIDRRDAGEIKLKAAHFEHGIRGEASRADMEFVVELCRRYDVPLALGSAKVPEEAKKAHEGIEECARRLRHAFLEQERRRLHCNVIALAHHNRDRAETVLMNLLRGSGMTGAAAMPMRDSEIVRPLINVSPEEIRSYLTEIGQPFREDETNFIPDNPRNALRLKVLPLLREIYPGCEQALGRFARIAEDEGQLLDVLTYNYIQMYAKRVAGIIVIQKEGNRTLMQRAVRRFLPASLGYDAVQRAIAARDYADLGEGWRAWGDEHDLYLLPELNDPGEVPLSLYGHTELTGICSIEVSPFPADPVRNNGPVQVLNAEALRGAVVRLRRDGDRIEPYGMFEHSKSLGDYLTDRKVPLPLRDRLPVIAKGNEVLWVPKVGISESAQVYASSAAVRLEIKISEGKPL